MRGCCGGCVCSWGEGHAWLLPGGCAWLLPGGMHDCSGGHAWVLWGGVHGCSRGACMVALVGGAWLSQGGMRGCSGGVHGCLGACVVAPRGVWGHAWVLLGARMVAPQGGMHGCSWGGMCGCSRGVHGCPGGHAWLLWGVHGYSGGMHGCSGGACMVAAGGACVVALGGMCGIRRDMEIRSMSGWYASYWNAFLLAIVLANSKNLHGTISNLFLLFFYCYFWAISVDV